MSGRSRSQLTQIIHTDTSVASITEQLPSRVENVDFDLHPIDASAAMARIIDDNSGVEIARVFVERVKGHVYSIGEDNYVVWSDQRKLWCRRKRMAVVLMIKDVMHWVRKHCGSSMSQSHLPRLELYVRELVPAEKEWMDKLDTTRYALPAAGGQHVDLKTGATRDRTKEDMWTYELKAKLLPLTRAAIPMAIKYIRTLTRDASGNQCRKLPKRLRCVLGHLLPGAPDEWKRLIIWVGIPDTGKSRLAKMLRRVCPHGTMSPAMLMESRDAVPDGNAHTGGAAPMKNNRWVWMAEPPTGGGKAVPLINVAMVDRWVGEDRLALRDVGQTMDPEGVINLAQLLLSANKLPGLPADPEDRAKVLGKLYIVEFMFHFNKKDPEGKAYLQMLETSDDFRDQLFTYMVMCSIEQAKLGVEADVEDAAETERVVGQYSASSCEQFASMCVKRLSEEEVAVVTKDKMQRAAVAGAVARVTKDKKQRAVAVAEKKLWISSAQLLDVYYWWCERERVDKESKPAARMTSLCGKSKTMNGRRLRVGVVWSTEWLNTLTGAQRKIIEEGGCPPKEESGTNPNGTAF